MRNLKRVLSLALATVMLLGMMVIGAGAADAKKKTAITDLDKAVNKEAVTLMVDLGIIVGKPDGTFAPAETVDRATMAKLITYIMMGDVDQSSFMGTTTDLTDINGNWAEGYIKFCYSNKIISGDGQGKFNPSAPVTTAAAAKMLLVALGYDAKDRGYEGASWSLNIMRDAQSTREDIGATKTTRPLTKGTSVKANDPLTRDNAAQMIFNTLFVETVKAVPQWDSGKQYIQSYTPAASLATTAYGDLYRVSGKLDSVDANGYGAAADLFKDDGTTRTPALTAADKIKATAGDVGSTVVLYRTPTKFVSTVAVAGTAKVLATSSNGTSYANLTTKGKTGYIGTERDTAVAVYYNGTVVSTNVPSATTADGTYYLNADANKDTTLWGENALIVGTSTTKTECVDVAGKIGVSVTFYDNDNDGKYDVIKYVDYSFSKVTAVKAADEAKAKEATVTITGLNSGSPIKSSEVVGDFAALQLNDYVLAAKIGSQYYVYEPETFEGQMTAFNTSKNTMTIDGTVYSMAATLDIGALDLKIGATELVTIAAKKAATFYKDVNGNVAAAKAATADVKYAIVDKIAYVGGSGTGAKASLEAVLALSDGTTVTVNVNKINDIKTSNTSKFIYKTDSTVGAIAISSSAITTITINSDVTKNAALTGLVCSYTVTDDLYALTYLNIESAAIGNTATTTSSGATTPVKVNLITKGVPTVTGYGTTDVSTATGLLANNNTVYLIKTGNPTDGFKFNSYTGFKNVPSISITGGAAGSNATATVSYAVDADGATTFIYVNAIDTAGTTSAGTAKAGDMAYILNVKYTTDNSGTNATYIFDAILNGKVGTISTTSTTIRDTLGKGNLYELSVKDDLVTAATEQTTGATTYVKTDSLGANAKNGIVGGYTYDGTETVYVIQDGELVDGTAESAKDTDVIYVKVVDKNTDAGKVAVGTMYVIKTTAP